MSLSPSYDEQPQVNWELLSSTLSAETLQALQNHLGNYKTEEDDNGDSETIDTPSNNRFLTENALSNSVFKEKDYWQERFTKETAYDWLVEYKYIYPHLKDLIKESSKILIVGCGNSAFSSDLYDDGFEHIVNIDFSEIVIEKMQSLHGTTRPNMSWLCMDMLDLHFPDDTFDLVIDKAAMDAIMVDEGDVWDPESAVIRDADRMCLGISRVLKVDGAFVQISFVQPHFRTKYLMGQHAEAVEMDPYSASTGNASRYAWSLSYSSIVVEEGCLNSFVYIMKKKYETELVFK